MVTTSIQQLTIPDGEPWAPERPKTGTDESAVLACLEIQPGLTWTRSQLSHRAALPDRRVRKAIDGLRDLGHPIVPAKPEGYKLSEDRDEVRAFADSQRRRGLSILMGARRLRQAAGRAA